jgi:hypothetical protein
MGYGEYGSAFAIAALLGLLLLAVAIVVAVVLAVLSWRWSRRGASFAALAFPVCLPLWGIACAIIVRGPIRLGRSSMWVRPGLATPVFVGFCTLAAVLIWGRALWLRPGADLSSATVQGKRRREIVLSAAVAGFVYVLWVAACLRTEHQVAQLRNAYVRREAASNAAWVQGRIVASPRALCYSPDDRYLATADTHLEVWDLETGLVRRRWPVQVGNVNSIPDLFGFDDGGTRLALSVGQDVEVFDLNGDRQRITVTGSERWTEHGRQVRLLSAHDAVVVLHHGKAEAFDVHTGEAMQLRMAALQEPDIAALAVSRDAAQLATWSLSRKRVAAWFAGGSEPSWTASNIEASRPIGFALSADGRWLALATRQNQIVVWNAATGAEQLRLEAGRKLRCFAFSADGAQIVALTTVSETSTGEPQVHIWSLPAGLPVVTHKLPVSNGNFMALSPGGQEVAIVDPQFASPQNYPPTVRRFDTTNRVERRGFPASSR